MSDVTYVPGAGFYAYRIDGLRLSAREASDYLVERKDYRPRDAFAAVHLAEADAVNAADLPRIRRHFDSYQVDGVRIDAKSLKDLLAAEYRRTPAEVEQILKNPAGGC